jgi:tRNA modification GTPase
MFKQEETIAAVATPVGEGGISVIRVSGKKAFEIVDTLFDGKRRVRDLPTHTAAFGNIKSLHNGDRILDEVVVVVFRAPNSYTGEDVVEIHGHGGMLVTRKILDTLLESGIRHAAPGEFTKRAFLNGKMDLSQAEAVADIIHARSDKAHLSSLDQLKGRLSGEVESIRKDLLNFCSLIELELDFAEENIELVGKDAFSERVVQVICTLTRLIDSFNVGRVYRDGIKVVIAGKPNAGKSSILNALLQENRAIVTDIPGTTRDTIEEDLSLEGILFRIIDTAGLRDTTDPIESEGVQRTLAQIQKSDLALLIIDFAQEINASDLSFYSDLLRDMVSRGVKPVVVFNKIDIAPVGRLINSGNLLHYPFVKLSAKTGDGIDSLQMLMVEVTVGHNTAQEGSVLVTSLRHRDALLRARKSLELAGESIKGHASGEFVSVDLRDALDALGEITGVVTTEDILNNIFSQFCIGK